MTHTAVSAPCGSTSYKLFVDSYKHKIRPEGQAIRLRSAFQLDGVFTRQFETLRGVLARSRLEWGDEIVHGLMKRSAFPDTVDDVELQCINVLYQRHTRIFRAGIFDDNYLNSIEDIALFFIHHDVKSIMIAGSYRDLVDKHVDLLVDGDIKKTSPMSVGAGIKAITLALSIELNQIQRVYTMHERDVSQSLVKDLSYAGMLTAMPTGRRKARS